MNLFVKDLFAPEPPYSCEMTVFPVAFAPHLLAAIEYRIARYIWEPESRYRAEQALREVQLAILSGCMQELIESNNRIYRLLNQSLNGQEYAVQSTDPLVIVPAIPIVPDPTFNAGGLLRQIADFRDMVDNAVNGTYKANYPDTRGIKQMLQELIDKIEGSDFTTEEKLKLLGDVAKIAMAVL